MLKLMLYDFNSINHPNLMGARRSCGQWILLGSAGLPPKQDATLVWDLIGLPCQCKAIVLIATKAKEAWQQERSGLEEGRWRWRTPYPSISQVVIACDNDNDNNNQPPMPAMKSALVQVLVDIPCPDLNKTSMMMMTEEGVRGGWWRRPCLY